MNFTTCIDLTESQPENDQIKLDIIQKSLNLGKTKERIEKSRRKKLNVNTESSFKCKNCGFDVKTIEKLHRHTILKHSLQKCHLCDFKYDTEDRKEIIEHLKTKHSDIPTGITTVKTELGNIKNEGVEKDTKKENDLFMSQCYICGIGKSMFYFRF